MALTKLSTYLVHVPLVAAAVGVGAYHGAHRIRRLDRLVQQFWRVRIDLKSVCRSSKFAGQNCWQNCCQNCWQFRSWFLPGIYMYRNQNQIISLSIDQACCVICCTLSESVACYKQFNLLHTICCTLSESVANSLVWISCKQFSLNQLQTV